MTEIIHVDKGEVLFKISSSMPKSDLIELLETRLKVPISLLILYSKDGKIIDLEAIKNFQDITQLFLFRRDSVVETCTITQSNWVDFKDFPEIDIYELPFQFEIYEKFPQGYEKVPRIEKCLYELYKESKQLYSKFIVKNEFIENCKTFIDIRLKASIVLLNNLNLYYCEIKEYWKTLFASTSELSIQYNQSIKSFEKHFELFSHSQSNEPIYDYLRDARIDLFSKNLIKKFNKYLSRIHEMKNITLRKIKNQISASYRETEKVQGFYQYSSKMYSEFDITKKAEGFASLLKVCGLYSVCRENISSIVNQFVKDKKTCLSKILALEKQMNKFKEISMQQSRVLVDIEPLEIAIRECVRRVDELYKEKVISMTSLTAQKLKYKVKFKLDKFSMKFKKFKDYQEFLKIPLNAADAQKAFEAIRRKYELNRGEIGKAFEKIGFELIEDNQAKKDFLDSLGNIVPSEYYKGINSPVIESGLIKRILKLEIDPEDREIEKVQTDKLDILDYYRDELSSFQKEIESGLGEYVNRSEKLTSDIRKTVSSISEIEELYKNNENLLRNIKQELEIVKSIGHENLKNKLDEELQKLKEKEEAFKIIFMEKNKEVSDMNSRLRFSVIKNEEFSL